MMEALADSHLSTKLEVKHRVLCAALDVLERSLREDTYLKRRSSTKFRSLASDLWNDEYYRKVVQTFGKRFTDREWRPHFFVHAGLRSLLQSAACLRVIRGHAIFPVAFLPDGKRVISGSFEDNKHQIWDVETGTPLGKPFRGPMKNATSVAFSSNGERVVWGTFGAVWIWNIETGTPVGKPLEGHTDLVQSVAISPDGKRVVSSGLWEETGKIWDVEKETLVGEFQGFADIRSVAFSPDGKQVVSGSADQTVRIWNVETGMQVGEPFQGHTGYVLSVAFSSDGKHVVSASSDKTIRIWNTETGMQVGEPFQGHTCVVNCVAFSPDGQRVASGSLDKTVRIWDVETGTQVGESFQGHTEPINHIAFSPDGMRIASASEDLTIRIWDCIDFTL
jgi:WD40 repeat protein